MNIRRLFSFSVLSLSLVGCALSPGQSSLESLSPPTETTLNLSEELSSSDISDFLIQRLNNNQKDFADRFRSAVKKIVKQHDKWYSYKRKDYFTRAPELNIQDVRIKDGDSIMGSTAVSAITPEFSGRRVELTLLGNFTQNRKALTLDNFVFAYDSPLIQETLIEDSPKSRILLDDSILLQVISVEKDRIQVVLENKGLPDLYLKGLHKLSIEHEKYFTDTLIQVGEPQEKSVNLQPRIISAETLRNQAGVPLHIRLTGTNFMAQPKFSYFTIDGEFGFGFQTQVFAQSSGEMTWETVVHIPNPETFDNTSQHLIAYASPFGTAIYEFNHEEQAQ